MIVEKCCLWAYQQGRCLLNIPDAQSTSDISPALAICLREHKFEGKKSRSPAIATCCLLAYSQALMGSLLLQVTGTRSASSGSGSPNATANWTRACASCSWQMLQCRHAPSMPVHLYNVPPGKMFGPLCVIMHRRHCSKPLMPAHNSFNPHS